MRKEIALALALIGGCVTPSSTAIEGTDVQGVIVLDPPRVWCQLGSECQVGGSEGTIGCRATCADPGFPFQSMCRDTGDGYGSCAWIPHPCGFFWDSIAGRLRCDPVLIANCPGPDNRCS